MFITEKKRLLSLLKRYIVKFYSFLFLFELDEYVCPELFLSG